MRKTWVSSNTLSTRAVELARLLERRAERLLDDHPHLGVRRAATARCRPAARRSPRRIRARSRVEGAVQPLARPARRSRRAPAQLCVDGVVVERARHVPDVLEQALQHVLVGRAPREAGGSPARTRRGSPRALFLCATTPTRWKRSGSAPSWARLYSAGSSLRRARSPVAPKMTSVVGATGRRSRPAVERVLGSADVAPSRSRRRGRSRARASAPARSLAARRPRVRS